MPEPMLNIPPGSFLLSLALIICLAFVCGMRGFGGVWKILRNIKFAILEIVLICLFTIIGSTLLQGRSPATYQKVYGSKLASVILFFDFDDVFGAFWFNFLLLLLCLSILSCVSHRYRLTWMKLGFLVTHIGLLVIGAGAIATGFFEVAGRMIIHEGESSSLFFEIAGENPTLRSLPFAVVCERFWLDHYDSGNGKLILYRRDGRFDDYFQADPGNSASSTVYDATISVIDIFPDFIMDPIRNRPSTRSDKWRNPAALVEVERDNVVEREILFHRQSTLPANPHLRDILMQYSRDPQFLNVKSYNSTLSVVDNGRAVRRKTIVVNKPLRYKGYTFYQSDWDKEQESYTILEVKKDPGDEIFYVGGTLLILGVIIIFYVNPLLRRRKMNSEALAEPSVFG
ncbi:MAG: cytochrome c biogenesis protein ResB [bacterium]